MHFSLPPWARVAALATAGGTLAATVIVSAIATNGTWEGVRSLPSPPVVAPGDQSATELAEKLAALAPRGRYVVVDTYANRLKVFARDGELLREALCATGSGTVLRDPRTGQSWTFDSPLGEQRVRSKTRDPIWTKPDWAFIEEGEMPPRSRSERVDDFSLGDYALNLGNGNLIHGTVFQTLLGRAVTHGCVRLGDEDLVWVFREVPVGASVFFF